MIRKKLTFPEGFLWGAATSAHQVEGGNHNDWTQWEQANAERLGREAKDKYARISPVWAAVEEQANNPSNYISGRACEHYDRFETDFNLAQELGMNAHRFSIEWSRIEPEEGKFDQAAVEHYRKVIQALRDRGMEPFVTLWHWTLPVWLARQGGWLNPKTVSHFTRYASFVAEELGADVRFWLTLNEPDIYTEMTWRRGVWPPQNKSLRRAIKVINNLVRGHIEAYGQLKIILPQAQVGVAKNNIHFNLHRHFLVDFFARNLANAVWNNYFLNRIKNYQDFIGLNSYFGYHHQVKIISLDRPHQHRSDLGWELFPDAIYYVLKGLRKFNKPVYITENGLADMKDNYREWFIINTLRAVNRAIQDGVDVRGYLHWSLLDNFEWDKGFWPRFGLIEVDYQSQQRTIRPSARAYAEIIKRNSLPG